MEATNLNGPYQTAARPSPSACVLTSDPSDICSTESGQTHFEHENVKSNGQKTTDVVSNGACVDNKSTGKTLVPDRNDLSAQKQRPKKYVHGQELERGEWLTLSAYKNPRTGSFSFRVSGQLPTYSGPVRLDFCDKTGRQLLIPGQRPRYLRDNFESRPDAKSFLHKLEQAYNGVTVARRSVETELTEAEVREYEKLNLRLKPYRSKIDNPVEEAGDLFEERFGNLVKPISLQQLYVLMREKEADYLSKDSLDKIGVAVNAVCRNCGSRTGFFNAIGKSIYDMQLGDVTVTGLEQFLHRLSFTRAIEIYGAFRRLLKFGKAEGYIRRNVAEEVKLRQTRSERLAKAIAEIAIDTVEQVQIALNIAAEYSPGTKPKGYFVPHVVFMYYGAMRPLSELRNLNPTDVRLHKKLIRLWSTKKMKRRIKTLPANAVGMLNLWWDGKPLSFQGWNTFWKIVQAAQGYDVKAPAWFKAPEGPKIKPCPDVPRHTGCSHAINRFKNPLEAVREDDHSWETFRQHYDGLETKPNTAIFCILWPETRDIPDNIQKAIRDDLIEHELVAKDEQFPTRPKVAKFNVSAPERKVWLPLISDMELCDKVWRVGVTKAAKELGTNAPWLSALCRAKRIPCPGPGRSSREKLEAAPLPPPVTTLPNQELEKLIEDLHGVAPAAKKLGIKQETLAAYCAVNKIRTLNGHQLGIFYNNRPRVKTSREQVEAILSSSSTVEEAATKLKVTPEYLKRYCTRHAIGLEEIAAARPSTPSLEQIKDAVNKDLEMQSRRQYEHREAMEIILSKATNGLRQEELIDVARELFGIKLTPGAIQYVIKQSAKGRFSRNNGSVRLVGAYESNLDTAHLNKLLRRIAGQRKHWFLIEALRCAVPMVPNGMSVDQLLKILPTFGIHLERDDLKRQLKTLDRQHRVRFYYNQVKILTTKPDWKRLYQNGRDATPSLDAITAAVKQSYGAMANKTFTNVEVMEFLLSFAPDGLWQHELLSLAKECGMKLKQSCIHSVVQHEAYGRFKREDGRLRLIGPYTPRLTVKQIEDALPTSKNVRVRRKDVILHMLNHFPKGLSIDDLIAGTELCGHKTSRDTFRRQLYYMAKIGQLQIEHAHVKTLQQNTQSLVL